MTPDIRPAFTALLVFAFCSCGRSVTHPHPTPAPADSTLSINLLYPNGDTADWGSSYELIVSERGGNILLDTIASYNIPVVAKMATKNSVVDLTTITNLPAYQYYYTTVFTAVQPAKWEVIPDNNNAPTPVQPGTPSQVVYTNTPAWYPDSTQFSSLPAYSNGGYNITYDNTNHLTTVGYSGPGTGSDDLYVLFSNLGLYHYQSVNSTHNTISLAQMDTTAKVNYSLPPQYTLRSSFFKAYPDTADFTKWLFLYLYYGHQPVADLQYPPVNRTPFQKYLLTMEAINPNETLDYSTFSSTPPPPGTMTIPFPSAPIYTLNSTANNNFSVNFSQQPTTYTAYLSTANDAVYIVAPPDSTQINALSLLNSLNSKWLKGQNLSALKVFGFSYETAAGLDYSQYFLHQTDSTQIIAHQFASDLRYYRGNL